MKVILREDIEKLGERGDIVDVADGYARNYLLPKQMAVQAEQQKIEEIQHREKQKRKQEQRKIEEAQNQAAKMEEEKFIFHVKAGEEGRLFGSITTQDIAERAAEKGYEIDRRNIDLDENIKSLGEHKVPVKIYEDVWAQLNIEVAAAEEE